jgi:hypothetical protein
MEIWGKNIQNFQLHNFVPFKSFFNSSSKLRSLSIKFTKLKRDLHPILGLLGQFWFIKINLSEFYDCKQHLLRLIRTPNNENILLVSI